MGKCLLVKKFLCCFDLRNGSQIFAILTLTMYAIGILAGILILEKRREILKVDEEHLEQVEDDWNFWTDDKYSRKFLAGILFIFADVLVNACLILGCRKKNKWLLLPWLFLRALAILAIGILLVSKILDIFKEDGMSKFFNKPWNLLGWLSLMALMAFKTYLWLATLSLLHQFSQNQNIIQVVPIGPNLYGELPPAYSEKPPDYEEIETENSLNRRITRGSDSSGIENLTPVEVCGPEDVFFRQRISSIT